MTGRKLVLSLVRGGCAALCLSGCLGGRSPAPRFFQLRAAGDLTPAADRPLDENCAVELRSVALATYLNRPQLVDRIGPYEIGYREFARWAEPLDRNIGRVLADNLRVLLRTDRVVVYPQPVSTKKVVVVEVEISRFEARPGGEAVLEAAWSVRREKGATAAARSREFAAPVAGPRIEDAIAAQTALLADLSRLIAEDALSLGLP